MRVVRDITTRRQFLTGLGASEIAFGLLWFDSDLTSHPREALVAFAHLPGPWPVGAGLLVVGVLCLVAVAVACQRVFARVLERVAFTACFAVDALIAILFLGAWLREGTGLSSAVLWTVGAVFVWLGAGIVDPPRRKERRRD